MKIVRDPSGHVRGTVEGPDFVMRRDRSNQYLRSFAGWGVNASVWETVKRDKDVLYIVIKEPDTGHVYSARKADLVVLEECGELRTIDYSDLQVVLKEAFFESRESPQGRLF